MTNAVLTLNAGSSSLKFAVYPDADETGAALVRGEVSDLHHAPVFEFAERGGPRQSEPLGDPIEAEQAVDQILSHVAGRHPDIRFVAVGHRVVHGGDGFVAPVRLTPEVLAQLETLDPLAPLHQPHNLAAVRAVARAHPDLLQTASFDTAFHATQPRLATLLAVPEDIRRKGVRRYGFHGLSYAYVAGRLPELIGERADGRVVVAHLGQGASMCAMKGRRSIATTMGFSALDGLVMGTRCGALDPAVPLFLIEQCGMSAAQVSEMLYKDSGLKGVSGLSGDMKTLLASSEDGARLAVDLFIYRIGVELGALAAALGGLDALVMTGGIGAKSPVIRERIVEAAGWLGARIDADANRSGAVRIDAPDSAIAIAALTTDEESVIARDCRSLLG
ncbi:MAG: acetate/propionate family kinase [Hyphomonadaceae bacterium]